MMGMQRERVRDLSTPHTLGSDRSAAAEFAATPPPPRVRVPAGPAKQAYWSQTNEEEAFHAENGLHPALPFVPLDTRWRGIRPAWRLRARASPQATRARPISEPQPGGVAVGGRRLSLSCDRRGTCMHAGYRQSCE